MAYGQLNTDKWLRNGQKVLLFTTDYGRMMAISQILFDQYHTWDIFGLGLKRRFFMEKQLNAGSWTRDSHHLIVR